MLQLFTVGNVDSDFRSVSISKSATPTDPWSSLGSRLSAVREESGTETTPEGRDIYGQERDANISYGRLIEVKETYLTDTPAFPESTGKNSLFHAAFQLCTAKARALVHCGKKPHDYCTLHHYFMVDYIKSAFSRSQVPEFIYNWDCIRQHKNSHIGLAFSGVL